MFSSRSYYSLKSRKTPIPTEAGHPELNPSENIWDDLREKFFGNTVFDSMDTVTDRLCIAMNHYIDHPEIVRSITAFPWICSFNEC